MVTMRLQYSNDLIVSMVQVGYTTRYRPLPHAHSTRQLLNTRISYGLYMHVLYQMQGTVPINFRKQLHITVAL